MVVVVKMIQVKLQIMLRWTGQNPKLSWADFVLPPAKRQHRRYLTMLFDPDKITTNNKKGLGKILTNYLVFCPLAFCPTTFYFTWSSLSWGWWHSLSANPSILLNSLSFASTFSVSAALAMTRYLLGFALALPLLCTYDLDQVGKWDVWWKWPQRGIPTWT